MASLSKDKAGRYTVQFVGGDRKRRSVRLGVVPKKAAESVKLRVEQLNTLAVARLPMDTDTARWLGEIGDDLAGKLAAVGLIPPRAKAFTTGAFLAERLAAKEAAGFQPAHWSRGDRRSPSSLLCSVHAR